MMHSFFAQTIMTIQFGLQQEEFFADYHESAPYLQREAFDPATLGWKTVNEALYASEAFSGTRAGIRIHHNGFVPDEEYIEQCNDHGVLKRRLRKKILHRYLEQGATIIFNRMDLLCAPIRDACNQIARFVSEEVVGNGYIAFGDKESFGVHWDTHDVFVVQAIGRKRWRLFEPTFAYPLPGQTSKLHKASCPSVPVFDEILETGDLLYIPRGWWHTAIPLNEESFHIAAGIHPLSVIDYVKWMANSILPDIVECRRPVRFGSSDVVHIRAAAEKIFHALRDEKNHQLFQEIRMTGERFASSYALDHITTRRRSAPLDRAEVSFNSKAVSTPAANGPVINGSSPELPSDERLILCWLAG